MMYEKPMVNKIEMNEEDIITTSTCTTSAFIAGDKCDSQNQHNKFYNCTNNGHLNHGGQ